MTNYNERLDEILSNIDSIGYSWLEGRDEAKQAILSDLLEIIGETEIQVRGITQNKENPMYWTKGTKIDYELRQELREKVKKYFE